MKVDCLRSYIVLLMLWMALPTTSPSQTQHRSPHVFARGPQADAGLRSETDFDKAYHILDGGTRTQSRNCILKKQVYGWHPAWSGTAYRHYDFALLSTVAYHSYEVDPHTGGYQTIHQWRETDLVAMAHHNGSQVELTASLSGVANTKLLLDNPTACKTLTDSLVALVQQKKADGICMDFYQVPPSHAGKFADVMDSLAAKLRKAVKGASISMVIYPQNPMQAYDMPRLNQVADRFLIAVAPQHDASSKSAGPVAPLRSTTDNPNPSFEAGIQQAIAAGIPRHKLLATVPYFGYEWPTADANPGAKTTAKGKLVLLRDYEASDSAAFLEWDSASTTGWLPRQNGTQTRQLWIDQVSSLTEKYALAGQMDLAGVAIWALGYDHPGDRYWDLLRGQFADCGASQADELAPDTKPTVPGLEGPSSAERNTWNWVWMLGGGIIAIAIILAVKKYM